MGRSGLTAHAWALALGVLALLLGGCQSLDRLGDTLTGSHLPRSHMVSAANPLAAEAGLEILRQEGSAVDAAVAVQAVLGLVEPQSSGIGGGAFMLHWDETDDRLDAYDGRETAPAAVTPKLFLGPDGRPLGFVDAAKSGRAVGVPGAIALLALAHGEHGQLPWQDLFEPAIRLAEEGFAVSPRLHALIGFTPALSESPATRALYFTPDGEPLPVGAVLRNPAYAETLRAIAAQGPRAFYEGAIAEAIVEAVQNAPNRPGTMTLADLERYQAKHRAPLCSRYRAYTVCGMPPPSSGGVAVLAILKLLEPFDMAALTPGSADAVHLISEASNLAYADRDLYVGDSDFVAVPLEGLLDEDYLATRSALIDPKTHHGKALAGIPPGAEKRAAVATEEVPSTSHFSIVDGKGNVVAMTTTVEFAFGSNLMAGGFILNNQLTDFSFEPTRDGQPVANAVAPGKRPRSSMSPTIVFDGDGRPILAVGSPGGNNIIAYVAQTLIGTLDWSLTMQEAIDLPRHVARNGPVKLEAETALETIAEALRAMGHTVEIERINSGLHGIRITAKGLDGGADPRREGRALGD